MSINSSVFSSLINLDNYVSDSTPYSESIVMVNLNNPGNIAVGDFLIAPLEYPFSVVYFEGGTHTLPHTANSGNLTPLQTGLVGSYHYDYTQMGFVKMKVGSSVKKLEIREYYRVSMKNVVRIFEVLADHTTGSPPVVNKSADYDFLDTALFVRDNIVSCTIEAYNYGEADTTSINIGTNGTHISASYVVGSNDVTGLGGDAFALNLTIRLTDQNGTIIHTSSDSGSQEAEVIQVSHTVSSAVISSASKIWIRLELSITPQA